MNAKLFEPITIRDIKIQNRVMMSPMCQYSAKDGFPNEWHYVHYATRAVGKVGLIMVEATAVEPRGRISYGDLGIWSDAQIELYRNINDFILANGSIPGIQIAHAGRKACATVPWEGSKPIKDESAWKVVAPSGIPFVEECQTPHELTKTEIDEIVQKFKAAAERAYHCRFQVIEIHAAHGYLLHEFLSPISNKRNDEYGGSLENRQRLLLRIVEEVRKALPDGIPVFVRMSVTDWTEGGWTIEDTIDTATKLKAFGVDFIDVSSGGLIQTQMKIDEPGYHVPFSKKIKDESNISTAVVGLITDVHHAESILAKNNADIIVLGRELLRNPYWAVNAAKMLNSNVSAAKQYKRAYQ